MRNFLFTFNTSTVDRYITHRDNVANLFSAEEFIYDFNIRLKEFVYTIYYMVE